MLTSVKFYNLNFNPIHPEGSSELSLQSCTPSQNFDNAKHLLLSKHKNSTPSWQSKTIKIKL